MSSIDGSVKIDRKELAIGTTAVSLALLGVLLCLVLSEGDFNKRLFAVVGTRLGMSPQLYVALFMVLIWLPLPWWFWNLLLVRHYARIDPVEPRVRGTSGVAGVWALILYMRFLVRIRGDVRQVKKAKLLAFAGFLYLLGVFVWWLAWTTAHNI